MGNIDEIFMNLEEVVRGKGFVQNPFHEFDVYGHTLKFVDEVKKLTNEILFPI
ncbi:MAG: hypothetical protein KAS15_04640 [Nanoarchaeota archaeon]|nr:hypothetical protein [Nanoarchaeota archaeon]